MNAKELLASLLAQGVRLDFDGEAMLVDGPDAVLTDEVVRALSACKPEIRAILDGDASACAFDVSSSSPASGEAVPNPPLPCSPAQESMLILEGMAEEGAYYNISLVYALQGEVNLEALQSAIDHVVSKHEVLRTTYKQDEAGFFQIVQDDARCRVDVERFAQGSNDESVMQSRLRTEIKHRFNLERELPIRCKVFLSPTAQILALTVHHIAADGYSARTILGDIAHVYGLQAGVGSSDPATTMRALPLREASPSAPNYTDFASWQRSWLNSDACRQELGYWTKQLAGLPELHSIPTDFARPKGMSIGGVRWSSELESDLVGQLENTCRALRVTPFVLFQAAFAALLSRYSGESDIVFGTVVANRHPIEYLRTVGMFANTVVLRYDVSDSMSFDALIEHSQHVSSEALRHQRVPFDVLVDRLNPTRQASYNPLVQVMLVMQDASTWELKLPGLQITRLDVQQDVSKFDLALHVHQDGGQWSLHWEYRDDLFEAGTIAMMSEHLVRYLRACIKGGSETVASFALVDDDGADDLIIGDRCDDDEVVHAAFERHVRTQPDATSVIDGERHLSYQQLDQLSSRIAAALLEAGCKPGDPVGVCMERSAELVASMLATYKLGAIYVPLDPYYPSERLDFMVADSGMRWMLHSTEFDQFSQHDALTCIDVTQLGDDAPIFSGPSFSDADGPAYVIYTSGTTGRPKGVVVRHRNLFRSLQDNGTLMKFCGRDVMPTVGSQAFGASFLEMLLPLTFGGSICMTRRQQVNDVRSLIDVTQACTVIHAVPSFVRVWFDEVLRSPADIYSNLRLLLIGGEPVPDNLLMRLKQWRPSLVIRALYGMSECSVVCSAYEPGASLTRNYCIGKPHRHVRFGVFNRRGREQPTGVAGELWVAGPYVAQGYLDRPDLTDERFVIEATSGQRMYRTGDRVRRLNDGHYEFLGRVDHQVSLRGARIEMGEIESVALGVEGIRQTVAQVVELTPENPVLVLYYTEQYPSETTHAQVLKQRLKALFEAKLPDYMRPSILEKIDAFPLNPNGKIDRSRLPKPVASEERVEPDNDIEARLFEIWAESLGNRSFGVTSNFFEIGGNSLLAMKLIARVRAEFDIDVPLSALFSASTIRACRHIVEERMLGKFQDLLIDQDDHVAGDEMLI